MKHVRRIGVAGLLLTLAATEARAQFEAIDLVDLPAAGAWAEYQVTRRNKSTRIVMSRKVSFLGPAEGAPDAYRIQLEMESDDYGPKRVPVVAQLSLRGEDLRSRRDFLRRSRELVLQVGDGAPFRLPAELVASGIATNLVSGGLGGAGSDVVYSFERRGDEALETRAGKLVCQRRHGEGKAEIVINAQTGARQSVLSTLELWTHPDVPFGIVKAVTEMAAPPIEEEAVVITIQGQDIVELVAYGKGARSAIRGPVQDFDPARVGEYFPGKFSSSRPSP